MALAMVLFFLFTHLLIILMMMVSYQIIKNREKGGEQGFLTKLVEFTRTIQLIKFLVKILFLFVYLALLIMGSIAVIIQDTYLFLHYFEHFCKIGLKTWFRTIVIIFQNPKFFDRCTDNPNEFLILARYHGSCPECNQPSTGKRWCKECNSKKFQQNFGNWTSGNNE